MEAEKTLMSPDNKERQDIVLTSILKKQKTLEKKLEASKDHQKKVSLTTDGGDKKKISEWHYKKTSHYSNHPVNGEKHGCDHHGS